MKSQLADKENENKSLKVQIKKKNRQINKQRIIIRRFKSQADNDKLFDSLLKSLPPNSESANPSESNEEVITFDDFPLVNDNTSLVPSIDDMDRLKYLPLTDERIPVKISLKQLPKKAVKPKPLTFDTQSTLTASKTTRNDDVKTSNDIPKSMSSLQKSRESISMQVDSPKISESNEDDQFVDGDEAKRKFLESLHSNISVLETNGITPSRESTLANVIDTVKPRPQQPKANPIVHKEIDDVSPHSPAKSSSDTLDEEYFSDSSVCDDALVNNKDVRSIRACPKT